MKTNRRLLGAGMIVGAFVSATGTNAQTASDEAATEVTYDATRGRELDEGQSMLVRITNSIHPAQSVIVSIVSPTRPEYVLGTVPVGETCEWKIDTRLYVGGVRFKATSGPSGVTITNPIRAVSQARATWNLGINFMRYQRVEGESGESH